MNGFWSLYVFAMILFVVKAWICYAIDRAYGKSWYQTLYNFSHEKPLAADVGRGFVCQQSARRQFSAAVVLSLAFTIGVAFISGSTTILQEFFIWLSGIVAILFGFATAPMVLNLWGKRDRVYATIDGIESGDIKPLESIKKSRVGKAIDDLLNWLASLKFWGSDETIVSSPTPVTAEASMPESPKSEPAVTPAQDKAPETPEDLMRPFLRGRRGGECGNN